MDRGIQIDAPAVVKQGDGRSRQRFRDAAGYETACAASPSLDVGEAEALGPHDLAVNGDDNHDCDGEGESDRHFDMPLIIDSKWQ